MKFKYYTDMYAKTLDFSGKSTIAEYWICVLYNLLFSYAIMLVALPFVANWALFLKVGEALAGIYNIVVFLPLLSLTIRRLHDAGHSGWTVALALIPIVGTIILIVYLASPSKQIAEVWNDGKRPFFNIIVNEPQEQEYLYLDETSNDVQTEEDTKDVLIKSQEETIKQKNEPKEQTKEEPEQNNQNVENNETKEVKPKARKSKKAENKPKIDKPLTRSQKIALLQQKQQSGEITEEEYQKQVLDILKH